jgi:dihydroorotase (multifunctional complex type)
MPQLVVKGGEVLVDGEFVRADLVIEDGKFGAITRSAPSSAQEVDARGKVVLPGVIDTHVHFREPGYTYKEDFLTGSRAAAAGGITMFMDMPNLDPPPDSVEHYQAQRKLAEPKAHVDYNHWAMPTRLDQISKMAEIGALGFKFFMKSAHYPYDGPISISDHAQILETFREIAKTGRPCAVHPHNMMLWEYRVNKWTSEGKTKLMDWNDVTYGDHDVVETTAITTIALLAEAVGCRLRILHIQGEPQVRCTRMLKAAGYGFVAEANPWGVFPVDPIAMRGEADQRANWEALNDGTIDLIGSDHMPHSWAEHQQVRESSLQSVVAGCPFAEHWFALYLTEVNKGRLPLAQLSKLSSENVARFLGIYPQKGAIRVGSDADLTIVDMKKEAALGESYPVFSKSGFTPFLGRKVKGMPVYTIVRGEVVTDHLKIVGKPGYGKFITRSERAAEIGVTA